MGNALFYSSKQMLTLNSAKSHEIEFPGPLIDNLTQSWTFAALQQILDETSTSSLPISKFSQDISTSSTGKMQPFGNHSQEQKLSFAEPKTMIHPTRSSSLNYGRSSSAEPPYSQTPASGQVVYEHGQYQERPVPGQESTAPSVKSGLQDLAGTRAQLLVVQRRILEHVGKALGWTIGWATILSTLKEKEDLTDVDINGKSDSNEADAPVTQPVKAASPTVGLSAAAIVNAISSVEQFRQYYEVCGLDMMLNQADLVSRR